MAGKKSVHKRAVEALLSDDLSALTIGGGVLFDVALDGIRQHEQRRNAPKGVSKRNPGIAALAEKLATAHPDALTVRLCEVEFLPQDDGEHYAGFEVWLGVNDEGCKALKSDNGKRITENDPRNLPTRVSRTGSSAGKGSAGK
jgi:hypothetical protein